MTLGQLADPRIKLVGNFSVVRSPDGFAGSFEAYIRRYAREGLLTREKKGSKSYITPNITKIKRYLDENKNGDASTQVTLKEEEIDAKTLENIVKSAITSKLEEREEAHAFMREGFLDKILDNFMQEAGIDTVASITGQDINVQFKGPSQSVLKSTVDFFVKQFPEIDVARRMSLNYDTNYLIGKYSGLIKISPEEVQVLVQPDISMDVMEERLNESGSIDDKVMAAESKIKYETKWSVKEFIALQLVASRIAKGRGIIQGEGMKISDIMSATRANPKSVTSRLSEMIKAGYVTKELKFDVQATSGEEEEERPAIRYRISTAGIHWLNHIIDRKAKTVNEQ